MIERLNINDTQGHDAADTPANKPPDTTDHSLTDVPGWEFDSIALEQRGTQPHDPSQDLSRLVTAIGAFAADCAAALKAATAPKA